MLYADEINNSDSDPEPNSRHETGDRRQETGDKRQETRDRRHLAHLVKEEQGTLGRWGAGGKQAHVDDHELVVVRLSQTSSHTKHTPQSRALQCRGGGTRLQGASTLTPLFHRWKRSDHVLPLVAKRLATTLRCISSTISGTMYCVHRDWLLFLRQT